MTADHDEWAMLDELLGIETDDEAPGSGLRFAFYGRCSTEDNQDPETSYQWQRGNAEKFVPGSDIVVSYFDVGQSRSVPWHRRREAARLLDELRNPKRAWDAIVVGEGTRCWFGNQFSLVAPRLNAHGVEVWVPELGGRFDARNVTHGLMMSMLGGLSESERQHVQQRTRASMDAQVLNEGRHQGGRAPYGYAVVDGPPHPNPNRASDGLHLRILVIDAETAPIVQRIFRDYIDGASHRTIANALNRDGIPCPSAHRPHQNRHRAQDGWQPATVHAILNNPRYTGYAVFGRWSKHEELLDPDDVAAGTTVRFRRSKPDRIIRSRTPAHPAIVSVAVYTEAQLARRRRQHRQQARANPRTARSRRAYQLRSRIRCAACQRRMQPQTVREVVYYRCRLKDLAPGSTAAAGHPPTVNLREDRIVTAIDNWLATLFDADRLDATIAALAASQSHSSSAQREHLQQRLREAETRVQRHLAAIEAGVDPQSLVTAMNQAHAQKAAAQAELQNLAAPATLTVTEIRTLVESLGDIRAVLREGDPTDKEALYRAFKLEVTYQHHQEVATVTVAPCVVNEGVRRGT